MDVFANATPTTVSIPFEDSAGNNLTPISASYRVLDENETELVESTAIALGEGSISVTVSAIVNALADDVSRGLRIVETTFVTTGGSVLRNDSYAVERATVLSVMENSFATLGKAMLLASEMPDLDVWDAKTDRQKAMALASAFHRLCKLRFYVVDNYNDQDRVNYGTATILNNISQLSAEEFLGLPARFIDAIQRAQVAEADVILDGDVVGGHRRMGLMSQTVGESSQMFRPGKPVILPVSERALRHLSGYVTHNVNIGRA